MAPSWVSKVFCVGGGMNHDGIASCLYCSAVESAPRGIFAAGGGGKEHPQCTTKTDWRETLRLKAFGRKRRQPACANERYIASATANYFMRRLFYSRASRRKIDESPPNGRWPPPLHFGVARIVRS
ncbi:hypothetical protein MRX96_046037 [Rhipicephalus microplus]